jgi:hypothetical protein
MKEVAVGSIQRRTEAQYGGGGRGEQSQIHLVTGRVKSSLDRNAKAARGKSSCS